MICVGVKEKEQLARCLGIADLIEVRLDLFPSWEELDLQNSPLPILLTPASLDQEVIRKAAMLKPDYLDIDMRASFQEEITSKIIISYHDFNKIPEDLNGLLAVFSF